MKNNGKKVLLVMSSIVVSILFLWLILAFLPTESKTNRIDISQEEAARLRQNFDGTHNQFTTSDGVTLLKK